MLQTHTVTPHISHGAAAITDRQRGEDRCRGLQTDWCGVPENWQMSQRERERHKFKLGDSRDVQGLSRVRGSDNNEGEPQHYYGPLQHPYILTERLKDGIKLFFKANCQVSKTKLVCGINVCYLFIEFTGSYIVICIVIWIWNEILIILDAVQENI